MNTEGLNKLGYGVECQVYEVNSKIVCKNFTTTSINLHPEPEQAQFAYRMQRIAHRYGLAPRALAIEGNQYYSERVDSLFDMGGCTYEFKESEEFQEFAKQVKKALGGDYADNHSGNIGRLPDDKLCVIDFGICGMAYSKIGKLLAAKIGLKPMSMNFCVTSDPVCEKAREGVEDKDNESKS